MWRDDALLLDIVLAASDAAAFVRDMDWDTFGSSRLHRNAVIRSLEIIGEAASKLSNDFKDAHPEHSWRDMINMRHRLGPMPMTPFGWMWSGTSRKTGCRL